MIRFLLGGIGMTGIKFIISPYYLAEAMETLA